MYTQEIQARIRQMHLLHSVSLELTYRCNLNCFYCYNDRKKKGTLLSLADYETILHDLADMQTLFLMLTGGEPMVHPDFFAIGRLTREMGFVVRLRTNGHLLTREQALRIKKEIQPYAIEVSLHGATADVHDKQTRTPGSFRQLVANIQTVKELGMRCLCMTTPTAWNQHQIEDMFSLCDKLETPLKFQGPVGPRDNGDTTPLLIQPEQSTWDLIERLQQERKKIETTAGTAPNPRKTPAICGVGTCGVDIDPFGNVQACMHLQESAGNLHEQSIRKIWENSPLFTRARKKAIEAAQQFGDTQPRQFGAPLFCLGVEENCRKNTFPCPT